MKWRCRACGTLQAAQAHYRGATCARCKAPLVPDEESVEIAFECPFCHESVDASAKRCSACARDFREASSSPLQGPNCPVCHVPLQEIAIGHTIALGCSTCSGAFIEQEVIDRWTADRASNAPDAIPGSASSTIADSTVRYRRCPRCAEWMNRINFGSASGIILDACAKDGIWFDGGELASAIAFARGGKLEAAKKRARVDSAKRNEKPIEAPRSAGAILASRRDRYQNESLAQWAVSLVDWFFGR